MKAPAMDGKARPLLAGAMLALLSSNLLQAADLDRLNDSLAGHVVDFTHNHGCDRRFYSESLGLERDMYVYLPPGYESDKSYPLILWIHGFGGGAPG
jgi:enterochelin esterase-like enzyme